MSASSKDLFGWQLNNLDRETFEIEVMEVFGECKNCELAVSVCPMPCEAVRRLVPKKGRIKALGYDENSEVAKLSYFALIDQDDVKFILLRTPDYLWATASYISYEQVPDWALSELHAEE